MSPNIVKETNTQKIPVNISDSSHESKKNWPDFFFSSEKGNVISLATKGSLHYLIHKTNKALLSVLLPENHKSIRKADEKIKPPEKK